MFLFESQCLIFSSGKCKQIGSINSFAAAECLGRLLSNVFSFVAVGCENFRNTSAVRSISSALSAKGKNAVVFENTDPASFRFAVSVFGCGCGVFVNNSAPLRTEIYSGNGFPLGQKDIRMMLSDMPANNNKYRGKVASSTSFRDIYISSILHNPSISPLPLPYNVSCGDRSVRELWSSFFAGEPCADVFQVSDSGTKVNMYSLTSGYVSFDRLRIAFALDIAESDGTVWLPDDVHFSAESVIGHDRIKRFSLNDTIPENAVKQRFLSDPLFMCVKLASDADRFRKLLDSVPDCGQVCRQIFVSEPELIKNDSFRTSNGKIIIKRTAIDRVSVLAQAASMEAASELCDIWTSKLERSFNCCSDNTKT